MNLFAIGETLPDSRFNIALGLLKEAKENRMMRAEQIYSKNEKMYR